TPAGVGGSAGARTGPLCHRQWLGSGTRRGKALLQAAGDEPARGYSGGGARVGGLRGASKAAPQGARPRSLGGKPDGVAAHALNEARASSALPTTTRNRLGRIGKSTSAPTTSNPSSVPSANSTAGSPASCWRAAGRRRVPGSSISWPSTPDHQGQGIGM